MRKIIHIDMDAFFASVEQLDHPEWRGKPLIVGGASSRRGVVSTCSYEARTYGVHSAMATARAEKLCPQGIFIEGNMARYREMSEAIRAIFFEYTDLVEPLSIDEAFLDVTHNFKGVASATKLARMLQREIFERTGLTASAGVSYCKFLAKVASDLRKPAGLAVIPPETAERFLENLPIENFYGIGKVTAKKFKGMNIRYGRDLKKLDVGTLSANFGKNGVFYYEIVRGIDERPVEIGDERKSVGRENTFPTDLGDLRLIRAQLRLLARLVEKSLRRRQLAGRSVTLKVRYDNFQTVTRTTTFHTPVCEAAVIAQLAIGLLDRTEAGKRKVRLLGISVAHFPSVEELDRPIQLEFDFAIPSD